MFLRSSLLALSLAATGALAQAPATLPANIQADRAAVQQAVANLKQLATQRSTDATAGSTAAAEADRTGIRLARLQLGEAMGTLHADAGAYLRADRDALASALTQLQNDQRAGNAGAIATDEAAVTQAGQALRNDRRAVFDGLGLHRGPGKRRAFHG
jgi:hypothetical protein